MSKLYFVVLFYISLFSHAVSSGSVDEFNFDKVDSGNLERKSLVVKGPYFLHEGLCLRDEVILTLINGRVKVGKKFQLFIPQPANGLCGVKFVDYEVVYIGEIESISFEKYASETAFLDSWCKLSQHKICLGYEIREFYLRNNDRVRFVVFGSDGKSYSIEYSHDEEPFVGQLL